MTDYKSMNHSFDALKVVLTEGLIVFFRFGINLKYLELPCDLITVDVLNELAQRCPNLTHLLLDFSHGAQLADFSGLSSFPTKIIFCVFVFSDNFIKKILNLPSYMQNLLNEEDKKKQKILKQISNLKPVNNGR